MLRPLTSTSGISKQLCFWIIFPHCVDISFILFSCKHNQKNKTFQFSSYLEAAVHTSRTLTIMPRFVYLIFLCPSPSHATQENVVFLTAIMVNHMNKSSTIIKTWTDFVITLNLQILLTDPGASHSCGFYFTPNPTWTLLHSELNQPWQPHSVIAVVFLHHIVPQSGLWEMSSCLKQQQIPRITVSLNRVKKLTARYEPHDWKVSCQQPHTPVTSRARFQQVGDRPDSWWGPHCL